MLIRIPSGDGETLVANVDGKAISILDNINGEIEKVVIDANDRQNSPNAHIKLVNEDGEIIMDTELKSGIYYPRNTNVKSMKQTLGVSVSVDGNAVIQEKFTVTKSIAVQLTNANKGDFFIISIVINGEQSNVLREMEI